MKTKEFIKKVESLGLEVHDFSRRLEVRSCGTTFATISKDDKYFGIKKGIEYLFYHEKLSLLKLLIEYSETPIEERGGPKKYYLRLPENFIGDELSDKLSEQVYLNFSESDNKYFFGNKSNTFSFKTQFTQEEINKIDTSYLIKEEAEE